MSQKSAESIHVVKLGGSLLDLPDLVARFEQWRERELGSRALLVVGGGDAADAVRAFDARFAIGEAKSHWLAMRAMQFNAHLVAAVLRDTSIVNAIGSCEDAWRTGKLAVVDPIEWMMKETADQQAGLTGGISHQWSFTSDSISAHIAARLSATRLTLLKSTLPVGADSTLHADAAGKTGVVDTDFAMTIRGKTIGVRATHASKALYDVQIVNLRAEPWTRCSVR